MKEGWGEGQVKGGSLPAPANDRSHEKAGVICRLIRNVSQVEPGTDGPYKYVYK